MRKRPTVRLDQYLSDVLARRCAQTGQTRSQIVHSALELGCARVTAHLYTRIQKIHVLEHGSASRSRANTVGIQAGAPLVCGTTLVQREQEAATDEPDGTGGYHGKAAWRQRPCKAFQSVPAMILTPAGSVVPCSLNVGSGARQGNTAPQDAERMPGFRGRPSEKL